MSYSEPPPPPYGGPPPGYGGPPPGYGPQPARTNKKAVWSLVTGILSLLCCGIVFGVIAIILAQSAKKEIAATGQDGAGLATAGMVLGIVGLVLSVLGAILFSTGAIELPTTTTTS